VLARSKRPDIEATARQKSEALAIRVSKLTVRVGENESLAGLKVKLDDRELGRPMLGMALPLDAGKYTIEASAPGHKSIKIEVTIGHQTEKPIVTVPKLEPLTAEPVAGAAPPQAAHAPPAAPRDAAEGKGRVPLLAYVTGSVGVVGLTLGGVFGLKAISSAKTASKTCSGGECTDQAGVDAGKDSVASAWISNVGFGVGLLAAGATVYLVATARSAPSASATPRWQVAPVVGSTGGGLVATRTFF
jgi:hypothetical protein